MGVAQLKLELVGSKFSLIFPSFNSSPLSFARTASELSNCQGYLESVATE